MGMLDQLLAMMSGPGTADPRAAMFSGQADAELMPPSTNDPQSREPQVFSGGVPLPRPRPTTPNTPAVTPTDASGITDLSSASAPLSMAPAAPQPSEGGGIGGLLGGLLKPEHAPMFLALAGGLSGAPSFGTGMRRAFAGATPAAMQLQQVQTQNLTAQALIKRGISPEIATAAARNPEILKQILPSVFGAKEYAFQMTPDGTLLRTDKGTGKVEPAYQSSKPQFTQIGEGAFGDKQYGFVDPIKQTVTSAPAAAAGASGGGALGGDTGFMAKGVTAIDHTLSGQDYLTQFAPEVQAAVRNYVAGNSMPTGNPRKGFTQAVKMIAQKYGEDTGVPVSDQKYVERRQYRNQLASGNSGVGAQRNALRQGLEHLEGVGESAGKLGNVDLWATWPTKGVNAFRGLTTDQQAKVNDLRNKVQQLSGEMGKFFSGSQGGGVHEREETRKRFNEISSPQELAAAIDSSLELLEGGLHAREQQRDEILGPNSGVEILSAKDKERIGRIRELAVKLRGGKAADTKAAPAATPVGSAPTPGTVKDGYRFKGGNPADKASWEKV